MATTNGTTSHLPNSEDTPPTTHAEGKRPTVCVFCGASPGNPPSHMEAARQLAQTLHSHHLHLVYGGGTVGLMGELAKTLVTLSGPTSTHGIIPSALLTYERQRSIDAAVYGRTTTVPDMHTRKRAMAREVIEGGVGGGFVALSGGYGTLEELMEMTTWNQLGIHGFPIVLFNVDGYWDGVLQWVSKAVESGFVSKSNGNIMVEARTAEEVVEKLREYRNSEGRFKLDWTSG